MRPLGVAVNDKRMVISVPGDVKKQADEILTRHFGSMPSHVGGAAPGRLGAYKHWPLDNFVALGKFLKQAYKAQFLLISTTAERNLAQRLADTD